MVNKIKITTALFVGATLLFITLQTGSDEERLKKISKEYRLYHLLRSKGDSSTLLQWTVAGCAPEPPSSHFITTAVNTADSFSFSKASPEISPHGNKLYKLYIKDHLSYINMITKDQPIGQVIVKETWNAIDIGTDSTQAVQSRKDMKWYIPSRRSELFIMYKEKESGQNDKGWVYGIISVEKGETEPKILTHGKISSCIGCHSGTKYDRIFGVKQ